MLWHLAGAMSGSSGVYGVRQLPSVGIRNTEQVYWGPAQKDKVLPIELDSQGLFGFGHFYSETGYIRLSLHVTLNILSMQIISCLISCSHGTFFISSPSLLLVLLFQPSHPHLSITIYSFFLFYDTV